MNTIKPKICFIQTLSPLHVGVGQGLGFIDLPIMRERSTKWPIIPGSTMKGIFRDNFDRKSADKELIRTAFGPDAKSSDNDSVAGALVFTDARLLVMPVRSLYGTFAYVSSRMAISRFIKDLKSIDKGIVLPELPKDNSERVLVTDGSRVTRGKDNMDEIYLEDFSYTIEKSNQADGWAEFLAERLYPNEPNWNKIFKERFVFVPDSDFDFFAEHGTEVSARIRINQVTGTVRDGALWYEESLPAETIMVGLIWGDRIFGKNNQIHGEQINQMFESELYLQIGGKASTGKGRVRSIFM